MNGIDVSKLKVGQWYLVDAGKYAGYRLAEWKGAWFKDVFGCDECDYYHSYQRQPETIRDIRGPIDFNALHLVTKASE